MSAAQLIQARTAAARTPLDASRSRRSICVRAAPEPQAPSSAAETRAPSAAVNVIQPISQWPTGVPPAMGGHLMASGSVAPISTSKGPGIDVAPMTVEYPSAGTPVGVEVYGSEDEVAKGLAARLQRAAEEAVQARGFFSLAISGGSLVATLAKAVAELAGQADFSKWQVLFVDERNVPHDSPDSNFGAARQALGAHLPPLAFWAIAEGLPVEQAAAEYAGQLLALATARPPLLALTEDRKLPMIDLVLLGVGPDGHVASLFPNSRQLSDASGAWVLPVSDSPKPPPQRITLSLPALNAAHEVAVVATGGGKAEVVQRALEVQACPGALPVQLVHPAAGALAWLLDAAAASQLHTQDWTPTGKGKAGWKFPRSEAPPAE